MTADDFDHFAPVLLTRSPDNHAGAAETPVRVHPLARVTQEGAAPAARPLLVVADHHRLIRHGLVTVLDVQGGCAIAAEAETWDALEACLTRLAPDVVLVAARLPGLPGRGGLDRLRDLCPRARVVLLADEASPGVLHRLSELGPDGLVLVNETAADLVAGVYAVLSGARHLSPQVSRALEEGVLPADRIPSLREREVLGHVTAGLTNKAIARAMGISVKTVEKHRDALMRKFDAHNAPELVLRAREQGWI